MKGHNYFALAIEGTHKQHDTILKKFQCHEDHPGNHPDIQMGRYRLMHGVLIIEIEGWGEQIAWAEEIRSFAEGLGCKVFWLDIPDWRRDDEPHQITNDTDLKYFEKDGPNECGVTLWGFRKEYQYN